VFWLLPRALLLLLLLLLLELGVLLQERAARIGARG